MSAPDLSVSVDSKSYIHKLANGFIKFEKSLSKVKILKRINILYEPSLDLERCRILMKRNPSKCSTLPPIELASIMKSGHKILRPFCKTFPVNNFHSVVIGYCECALDGKFESGHCYNIKTIAVS